MKTKLLVAVAAVLAAVCCIPLFGSDPATTVVAAVPDATAAQRVASPVVQELTPATEPTREAAPAPAAKEAPAEAPAEAPFDPSPVKVPPWLARFLVVDEDETPVADATITIWASKRTRTEAWMRKASGNGNAYSGHEPTPLLELHTDRLGHASTTLELECLAASADKAGVRSGEESLWHTRSNADETKFVLVAPVLWRGRVVRADGAPGAGAEVTATVNGMSTLQRGRAPAPEPVVADAQGRFSVPVQMHAGYNLQATLDGKQSFAEHRFILAKEPPEVVLVFPGAITLAGLVVDADGQPVPKADIRVWREYHLGDPKQDADDYETANAETGADGRFSVDVRQHRRYQLVAAADGCANSEAAWVETTAARPHAEVRLALQRFATIGGSVQHGDGSPFAGVQVFAKLDDQGPGASAVASSRDLFQASKATKSGEDGRFELTVHPGTNWTVLVWPVAGNSQFAFTAKDVKPGRDDVTIVIRDEDLAGCVVRGEVVTASDGQPVSAFEVSLVTFGDDGKPSSRAIKASIEGNRFELPALPIGRSYAIDVTTTERDVSKVPWAPVRMGPFPTVREGVRLDVRVAAWGELPVQVLNADGTPARGRLVNAMREPPVGKGWPSPQRLEAGGRLTLKWRVPGPHKLIVTSETAKLHELDVTILPGLNPEIVVRLPASSPSNTGR